MTMKKKTWWLACLATLMACLLSACDLPVLGGADDSDSDSDSAGSNGG
jgi:hypothetical protein